MPFVHLLVLFVNSSAPGKRAGCRNASPAILCTTYKKTQYCKKGVKGLCAKKKISKGLYGPHLMNKAETA